VLVGKTTFLEFCDADVVENRSEDVPYILHKGWKILLEDTDNDDQLRIDRVSVRK
jgi:ribulose bisphosphate carboxylase small subunit